MNVLLWLIKSSKTELKIVLDIYLMNSALTKSSDKIGVLVRTLE